MIVTKEKDKIIVISQNDFNIADILKCGQVFSYVEREDGSFVVVSFDKWAVARQTGDKVEIESSDIDYFYNFFDFDTDYNEIKHKLCQIYPNFEKFFTNGQGIRILKQDKLQTILSFIVSANNNIKRIRKILFKLSNDYGRLLPCGEHAFPSIEELLNVTEEEYTKIGMGYRAPYFYDTVHALATKEYDITYLSSLPTPVLREKLLSLKGVGPKVADCILFFGFSRTDVFPVDTWIRKSYSLFSSTPAMDKQICSYFCSLFGQYSGYAQQYIFNYMISTKL